MLAALKALWVWVRAHAVLVGSFLIALVGFLVGVSVRKTPVIIQGKDPEKKKIEDDTTKQEQDLQQQASAQKQEIEKQHDQHDQQVVADEQKQAPALQSDIDATNDFLKNVGDQVRGGKNGGTG